MKGVFLLSVPRGVVCVLSATRGGAAAGRRFHGGEQTVFCAGWMFWVPLSHGDSLRHAVAILSLCDLSLLVRSFLSSSMSRKL